MLRSEIRRTAGARFVEMGLAPWCPYPAELGYREEMLALGRVERACHWGTVSRPAGSDSWTETPLAGSFFYRNVWSISNGASVSSTTVLRPRAPLSLSAGLNGTIRSVLVRLIDQWFIPHQSGPRSAGHTGRGKRQSVLRVLRPTPVIDITDPAVIEPLRKRMQVALLKAVSPPDGRG